MRAMGASTIVVLLLPFCAIGQDPFPPPPAEEALRIVAFNIKFLGHDGRTEDQLVLLAERMASFDAAVIALQEMLDKSTLEHVADLMGPEYVPVYAGTDTALMYDSSKVMMLESEELTKLAQPPYSSFEEDFPEAEGWDRPFAPTIRYFFTGVFQPVQGRFARFRVISCHNHWNCSTCKQYEGRAASMYVSELLETPGETPYIFLPGDYNSGTNGAPIPQYRENPLLEELEKSNEPVTSAWGGNPDHVFVTVPTLDLLPDPTVFVMAPSYFGETVEEFKATYSDHFPLYADFVPPELPPPSASARTAFGGGWKEEGDSVTFLVDTENTVGSVEYQWLKGEDEVAGATSPAFVLDALSLSDGGTYVARLTDDGESKAVFLSNPVLLTVVPEGQLPSAGSLSLLLLSSVILLFAVQLCLGRQFSNP